MRGLTILSQAALSLSLEPKMGPFLDSVQTELDHTRHGDTVAARIGVIEVVRSIVSVEYRRTPTPKVISFHVT